jgi:DNA-3-methyladenine glycosylase
MKDRRLGRAFYTRNDVVQVARDLLGTVLVADIDGVRCSGRIVESEAYRGPDDRACHAWMNRRTPRTEVMFREGGHAYIYLCYGVHHLFNVVTAAEDAPHAVLIRAIEPIENVEIMLRRRNFQKLEHRLTAGPGALSQALGIHTRFNGVSLLDPSSPLWIELGDTPVGASDIAAGPRVGVESAGESARLPWRFWLKRSPFVSRYRP